MKRAVYRIFGIAAALFVLNVGRGITPSAGQTTTAPSDGIDYQKTAENTAWNPDSGTVLSYWPSHRGKYTIRLDIPPGDRIDISILLDGVLKYKWSGHGDTVFDISGEKLYWVDYMGSAPGGTVVAVDLTKGSVEWSSKLKGVVAGNHSGYSNKIAIDVGRDDIAVWGHEDAGRYVEFKRLSDGVTVGHYIYPEAQTKPADRTTRETDSRP